MIKAVLFDLGGTLHTSDSPPGRAEWFAQRLLDRLADYGIVLDAAPGELAQKLHENGEAYKRASELDLRELPAAEIWNDWYLRDWNIGRERLAPIAEELSFLYDYERPRILRRPHLTQTMDRLKGMGLRLGLISNIISTSVAPHFLEEYGIREYMDCVVLSSVTGIRKPDPGIFRAAEAQLDLYPSELAYVGDTISRDVIGTRRAGWKLMIQISSAASALRDKGLTGPEHRPDYKIEDLADIPAIIERENAAM